MYIAEAGRFVKPDRAPQQYEFTDYQAGKHSNYKKIVASSGTEAKHCKQGVTIRLPASSATLARCNYFRVARSRKASGHVNPAASDKASRGRIFQFLAKISFPSKRHAVYVASVFARLTGRSSGARRRSKCQPMVYICSADTVELLAARDQATEQTGARGWWPANEMDLFALEAPA